MSLHTQKNHYAAIEDVHVNLENRNHAFDEYGYGPLNPKEPSDDFWKQKAEVFNTTSEEAKKSRCGNCAAFNQTKEIMKRIADGLGPAGNIVAEKADLGFCEMFKFKCAAERTCDAWLVNGPINESLAGAGTSADGGMSAPFSAMGQEIDSRRKQKPIPLGKTMGSYVDEDNVVGGGAVAGLGVGPQGEPGRPPELMPMQKRRGKFMNLETFIVPHSTFVSLREAKRKGKHWRTYLNEDDTYHDIREYAKNCKGPIIVEDKSTGAMMYVRYGDVK
jgi:hypothetical protein